MEARRDVAKLIVKGGRVIDPATGVDGMFDVLIEDGTIAKIGTDLPVDGAEVFDAQGAGIHEMWNAGIAEALADRGLDRDLDQVGGAGGRLARAA